ncbi:uncharacterized protein LOC108251805 isoform X4 [Diaphorina citri]|nr:uncharacterized protein LOC108251805 isoform X4 [Diaphorina citri]
MAARGYNVSVLHLRNSSEAWDTDYYSTRNYENNRAGSTRRKDTNSNSNPNIQDRSCCRELSPVRWCDKEVDGVYLGKSGWVQVQQRSLDDNLSLDSVSGQSTYNTTLAKDRKAISKMYTLDNPPKRPVYLQLSADDKHRDLHDDLSSPPPITPIISPPPAFQDATLPRPSPKTSKALARSNAVENTPPQSPSMRRNYFNLAGTPAVNKRLTPSPISSPQAKMLQTRSLEESTRNRRAQFQQKHDSSSSSSSSFGFRSLDGGSYPKKNIARLSETNSSLGLYDNDGDEEDNRSPSVNVLMVNYFPDSSNQHQSRHSYKHTRKSPGTEPKKVTPCSCSPSSSSSTSSSRSPSASNTPFRRSASHNNNKPQWDSRSHKVRRSRSLQLPERSPSLGRKDHSPSDYHNYNARYKPQTSAVQSNGFNGTQTRKQGKPPNLRYMSSDDKLRREAEEEARIVTEYLYGTRSREAARALLMQRCCEKLEDPPPRIPVPTETSYSVYLVPSSSQPRLLKRGLTSPSLGCSDRDCLNPCNPTTCDFWPHCSHRDGISTVCKSPNSYPYPTQQNGTSLKASQSYPCTEDRLQKKHNGVTYSSPPSLEQMNDKNLSVGRGISPCGDNYRGVSPSSDKIRASPCGGEKMRISPCGNEKVRVSPCGDKMRVSPCGDKVRMSPCGDKMRVSPCSDKVRVSPCGDKVRPSPAMCNGKIYAASQNGIARPPSGCGSSSSSDVWYTVSDRTTSKEMKTARSSGTCTPSLADSPNSSRPGSAPARSDCCSTMDAKQRSLSLPKSFQTNHIKHQLPHRQSDAWPGGVLSAPHSTRTAPATPIRDLLNGSATSDDNLPGMSKSSSTPLLDDPNPSWEWSQMNKAHDERIAPLLEAANQRHFSGYNVTESVLQKFRKSFSLRFYKKSASNSSSQHTSLDSTSTAKQYQHDFEPPDSPPHTDQKFRFGPLIWRSSKERRKGKKASRNQKCNSGDSGIQIEMVGRGTGDSSESHDTDHLADEEILDDTDSPLVVRRRGIVSSGSEGKPSRPTSDVISQVLIDKLKAELQSRGLPRRRGQMVRRTHSDLGGQRLFHWDVCNSYRKMISSPSPVKTRMENCADVQTRTKRIRPHHALRRSVSQPLGINELSPLLRRKPIGSRTSNTLSDEDNTKTSGGPPGTRPGDGTNSLCCSDDELLSDSESSVTSLGDRKRCGHGMDEDFVVLAEAVWDHVAMEAEELGFRAGDVIEVLDTLDRDWWWGTRGEASGWFPSAFVRLRVSQEDTVEDCLAALASGGSKTLRRRTSISLLSNDQVRSRVVRELINTERDFVKVLHDVSEGYLAECRRRNDMFSPEQIQTIFGNLEDILAFQSSFLEDLETKLDWDAPYKSCIGETFLKHKSGFRMYSEYCNSHPMAIATLQELYQHNNYSKFFEACRLMRGLIEIPLDGYLLTPVQRICKYPLQLAELLKYTKTDHPDYVKITEALEAMRDVAMLINERKRRMESLEKLAAWQQRVEGWEGEDLIETSSQLIHQGEVIRVTSGMWTNTITLFLFDHQLVYCKRDILKRNTHVYKARLNIDTSQIINLPDGKDPHLGVTVRHAIKIHCSDKDKWLLFCCRSLEDKARWLAAFQQERALVEQDREDGLEFAPAAKELARMSAARCHSSRPPVVKHRSKRTSSGSTTPNGLAPRSHSLGRRVGTWFNFGANKKNRTFNRAATMQTVVHPS